MYVSVCVGARRVEWGYPDSVPVGLEGDDLFLVKTNLVGSSGDSCAGCAYADSSMPATPIVNVDDPYALSPSLPYSLPYSLPILGR